MNRNSAHAGTKKPNDLAPDEGTRRRPYRPLARIIILPVFLLLFHSMLTRAASQGDLEGLIPPPNADHSSTVAEIREVLKSRSLSSLREKSDKLIQNEPANFEGYFWRGFFELKSGDNYEGVRFLRRAQALDANCHVLKMLAFSYYLVGQFKLFTLTMNVALEKQPDDFAPYFYLGRYYVSSEVADFTRAASYFRQAIERNPNHYPSHYYLGFCDEALGKMEDAEGEYQRSMKLADAARQKPALPHQGMARVRLSESRPGDALQFAIQAVELGPNDPANHLILASIYAALGQAVSAAQEWERAAVLAPTDPVPWYHLYRTYMRLGSEKKGLEALTRYKKLAAIYGSSP